MNEFKPARNVALLCFLLLLLACQARAQPFPAQWDPKLGIHVT